MAKVIKLTSVFLDLLPQLTDVQAGQLFKAVRLYHMSEEVKESCVQYLDAGKTPSQESLQDDANLNEFWRCISNAFPRQAFVAVRSQLEDQVPIKKPIPLTMEEKKAALDKRKREFGLQLQPFLDNPYSREMLTSFFRHWTQPNKSLTKLGFEMEDTWDLRHRLSTWEKNDWKSGRYARILQQKKDNESETIEDF